MIGNISPYLPHQSALTESFMKPYCGLCKSLRTQYDLPSSLLLNYELSFVLLSLDKYVGATEVRTRCPSSGFLKTRTAYSHPAVDKAAQLSVVLGWIKSVDFLADEKKKITIRGLVKMAERKLGKRSATILQELSTETHKAITEYIELSKNSDENIENIRKKTYALSSQVCYEIAAQTDLTIEERTIYMDFFGKMGVSIALLDPLLDIEKDLEKGVFNPIVEAYELKGDELKQHYISFFEEYKIAYFDLQNDLKKRHRFSNEFSEIIGKSLELSFAKIKNTTDKLFGGIEDKILEGMIGCTKTCEHQMGKKRSGIFASVIPLIPFADSCGNGGCKGGNCGNSCKPPSNCGKGCGNGCGKADCSNSCNAGDCGGVC